LPSSLPLFGLNHFESIAWKGITSSSLIMEVVNKNDYERIAFRMIAAKGFNLANTVMHYCTRDVNSDSLPNIPAISPYHLALLS